MFYPVNLVSSLSFFLFFTGPPECDFGPGGENVAEDVAAADFKVKRNERTREAEDEKDFII